MELLFPHLTSRGRREETGGLCQRDRWTDGQGGLGKTLADLKLCHRSPVRLHGSTHTDGDAAPRPLMSQGSEVSPHWGAQREGGDVGM